jgi:hypothetical protein
VQIVVQAFCYPTQHQTQTHIPNDKMNNTNVVSIAVEIPTPVPTRASDETTKFGIKNRHTSEIVCLSLY